MAAPDAVRMSTMVALAVRCAGEVSAAASRFERATTRDGVSASSAAAVRLDPRDVADGVLASSLAADVSARLDAEAGELRSTPAEAEDEAGPVVEDSTPLSAPAVPTCDPTSDQPISAAPMPADAAPSCSHRRTGRSSARRLRSHPVIFDIDISHPLLTRTAL
ncbi:hypothetical protein [Mycolicibacterium sp. F2034L]|uniref:hypothetical protein n=1 Tax=Mycolicibacterium sp. F2034L TaxID=2926422 RepID=UPI001FF38E5B|nr:hypothetical protein [Mycolicibacterium sp. F2034L]